LALAIAPAAISVVSGFALTGATASPKGQMRAADGKVAAGERVRLIGRVPEFDGNRATIQFQPAGENDWRPQRKVALGPAGGFSVPVQPVVTGLWRAAAPGGHTTGTTRVRVRSDVDVAPKDRHIMGGGETEIAGHVTPRTADRRVVVSVGGEELTTKTNNAGRFEVDYEPPHIGTFKVNATAKGDRLASGSKAEGGPVNVYRTTVASWYTGGATACGGHASQMGVAHRSLPCGTMVKFRHGNNTVTVPVIDRGPYIAGREWDLTAPAKNALGCGGVCTVLSNK
jgi:hypothetical protein